MLAIPMYVHHLICHFMIIADVKKLCPQSDRPVFMLYIDVKIYADVDINARRCKQVSKLRCLVLRKHCDAI